MNDDIKQRMAETAYNTLEQRCSMMESHIQHLISLIDAVLESNEGTVKVPAHIVDKRIGCDGQFVVMQDPEYLIITRPWLKDNFLPQPPEI